MSLTKINNLHAFCIIPAFNEESNIEKVIQEIKPYLEQIVVVDDASTDNTFDLARKQNVTVLRHIINRGQGAALQTGNQYALENGADIIIHYDADGQFSKNDLVTALEVIKNEDYDAILGSRFHSKENKMPWLKKNLIFPIARIVNRVLFKIMLKDPQSGFRVMKKEVVKKIVINNDGSAHCSEILYKLFKNNFKIKEIPITVVYKDFGQSFFGGKGRGMGGARIIKDLILQKIIN